MSQTIQAKEKQLAVAQNKVAARNTVIMPDTASLALQRIQAAKGSPLQMKQDLLALQRTIGNRALVQLLAEVQEQASDASTVHNIAAAGVQGSGSKLPHYNQIQAAFGHHDVSHVQAYTGSTAAAASMAIGAEAYATGTKIAFADSHPNLHTAAHEAAHVIQQQAGVQLKNGVGEVGDKYEQHADQVADAVVQSKSAQIILSNIHPKLKAGGIQAKNQSSEPRAGIQRLSDDESKEKSFDEKAEMIEVEIDEAADRAEDTLELYNSLQAIKTEYNLKFIDLVDVGTPRMRAVFRINPVYEKGIVNKKTAWRMLGNDLSSKSRTNVLFIPSSLTVLGVTAKVGEEMIANPLSQDHLEGSDSSNDKEQNNLMSKLPNAGITSVPNPEKYIKGHLLNDNIGGPGHAINLFPITADANAKHLAFVEKYVKANIQEGYVCYYTVKVDHIKLHSVNAVDADFICEFFRYQSDGKTPVANSHHKATIESRYPKEGAAPYDILNEFEKTVGKKEFGTLNKAKTTPKALVLGGEEIYTKSGYTLDNEGDVSGIDDSTTKMGFSSTPLPKKFGQIEQSFLEKLSIKHMIPLAIIIALFILFLQTKGHDSEDGFSADL